MDPHVMQRFTLRRRGERGREKKGEDQKKKKKEKKREKLDPPKRTDACTFSARFSRESYRRARQTAAAPHHNAHSFFATNVFCTDKCTLAPTVAGRDGEKESLVPTPPPSSLSPPRLFIFSNPPSPPPLLGATCLSIPFTLRGWRCSYGYTQRSKSTCAAAGTVGKYVTGVYWEGRLRRVESVLARKLL